MAAKKKPTEHPDLADLERRHAETLVHLEAIKKIWPDLTRLPEKDRKGHVGRIAVSMARPFSLLFGLLTRPADEGKKQTDAQAAEAKLRAKLCDVFDASLGGEDMGTDDETFEADLLQARLERVSREHDLAERLEELSSLFNDDALHVGGQVAGPGLAAIDLAKSIGRNNPELRSLLAPVLDALREMTKAARSAPRKGEEGGGGV